MGRKGRKKPWHTPKTKRVVEVEITGPSNRELVERIRNVLEDEFWWKEVRYKASPNPSLEWQIERFKRALDALDELERRAR